MPETRAFEGDNRMPFVLFRMYTKVGISFVFSFEAPTIAVFCFTHIPPHGGKVENDGGKPSMAVMLSTP